MDRYETLREIGANHYGTIWEGNDFQMDRRVAIMALHEKFFRNPRISEQIWRDIKAMSDIRDKNMVPVHDIVPEQGWIVMELMRGSLGVKLLDGPLAADLARSVMRQILEALVRIHAAGRIHGDVKPNNMLYNDEGRVLISFSPGLYLAGTVPNRQDDQKYQAPELLKTDAFGAVGPAVDLYCLGFSILELLKGPGFDSLFRGAGLDPRTAWTRWHGDPDRQLPAAREVVPDLHADLSQVIDRLLRKKVEERYATAEEVLRDLTDAPIELVEVPHDFAAAPATAAGGRRATQVTYEGEAPLGPAAADQRSAPRGKAQPAERPAAAVTRTALAPAGPALKPWSREWINKKLESPVVMTIVILLVLLPVVLVGAMKFLRGGDPKGGSELAQAGPEEKGPGSASAPNPPPPADDSTTVVSPDPVKPQPKPVEPVVRPQTIPPQPVPPSKPEPAPKPQTTMHEVEVRIGPKEAKQITCRIDGQASEVNGQTVVLHLPQEAGASGSVSLEIVALGFEPFRQTFPRESLLGMDRLALKLKPAKSDKDIAMEEARAFYEVGMRYFDQSEFEQALGPLTEAIARVDQFADAWLARGRAQAKLGRFEAAISDLRKAVELDSQSAENHVALAYALADSGDFEEASRAYNDAISCDSGLVSAWIGRSHAHYFRRDFPAAFADAVRATELAPDSAVAFNSKGAALMEQQKYTEALDAFGQAIILDPTCHEALLNRGRLYFRVVNEAPDELKAAEIFAKSIRDLSQALELRPDHAPAYNARGLSYASSGKSREAIADYDQAIKLDSRFAAAYYNRGLAYKAIGQYERWKADHDQALSLDSSLRK